MLLFDYLLIISFALLMGILLRTINLTVSPISSFILLPLNFSSVVFMISYLCLSYGIIESTPWIPLIYLTGILVLSLLLIPSLYYLVQLLLPSIIIIILNMNMEYSEAKWPQLLSLLWLYLSYSPWWFD